MQQLNKNKEYLSDPRLSFLFRPVVKVCPSTESEPLKRINYPSFGDLINHHPAYEGISMIQINGDQCVKFGFCYSGGLGGGFNSTVTINLAKNVLIVEMENDEPLADDGIGGSGYPPEFGFNGEVLPGCKENGKLDVSKPFTISLDADDLTKMRAFKRCFFYEPLLHLHNKPDELVEYTTQCNGQKVKFIGNKYGPRIETIEGELIFRDEEGISDDEYDKSDKEYDLSVADIDPDYIYKKTKNIFYRSCIY
jgi:hypothetical protein